MRSHLLAIVTLTAALAAGTALAAEVATGKVTEFNTETRMLVLEDGKSYLLADAISVESLDVGDEVVLSFDKVDDKMVVSEMQISE